MSLYKTVYNFFARLKAIKTELLLISLLIGFAMFYEKLNFYFKPKLPEVNQFGEQHGVFSEDQLSNYNGLVEDKLYLAVLGSVFDVSKGAKYYAKGGSYHYFVGKDGSRALVTGDFTDESENKDNVIDLS
ncbi:putative cytochrome b5 domain containing 2, partial [Operophtera brumata]